MGNSPILPTGELNNDSTLIAFDDLRIANSKLIELEYQKEINAKYKTIIQNDSIIINNYRNINNKIKEDSKKYIYQRNLAIGVTIICICVSTLLLVK